MTDTVDAGDTISIPGADAWQRAGLTRSEAIRRERVERWRAETLSPWEARAVGLVVWLAWRTVFKGFQPLCLIAALAAASWFGVRWLDETGGLQAHVESVPGEERRLAERIRRAVPPEAEARDIWIARLEASIRGDTRRRADIDRFRSWAALGPDLMGRDWLALDAIAGAAGPRVLDAELRAGPDWQRRQRLDDAWRELIARGRALGLDPPALVFAPEALNRRRADRQFAWAVAREGADGFFRGDYRGQFEMRAVPGLVAEASGTTRLYGGVRHLVIALCAQARTPLSGCDSPIIPPAAADELSLALAAIESGLVELPARGRSMRSGAEILIAARRAGQLNPQLEAWLVDVLPRVLPAAEIRDAVDRAGVRPDIAFAAPARMTQSLAAQLDARTTEEAVVLATVLQRVADLREVTSSFEAIRLMAYPDSVATLDSLQRVGALSGPATLAVMEWLGEGAYDALLPLPERPEASQEVRRGLIFSLGAAILVLLLTLVRVATPARLRRASRTSLTDAWISRLLLGRKL
ncbi:hypothetical protein [Maricaulis maris]|uniref:hypothetical protein n=1 Tax=Maricaulis maris TaxID=74318 RepID=UPI003B8C34DB